MVHDDKRTLAWFYSDRRELLFGIERVRGLLLSTERYKFCSIGMALILRFAVFALLLLPYQCEAKTEGCSETQCLLLPDGDDLVASKFHSKASEKGVRLVYINLVIGNASYDPLELPYVFLPHRWVWANTIHEPMLSLPDDYDILSLGLLNYQVRSIDVKLKDQPSGCLAKLNSMCKIQAVGRMLLENVTSSISDEILQKKTPVVCVARIRRNPLGLIVTYQCCDVHKEVTEPATLRCNQFVDVGGWRSIVFFVFFVLSFVWTNYAPALPLALPDYVFSLKDEVEKENRLAGQTDIETTGDDELIPVDDSSPMNVSTLLRKSVQKLPDIPMSFNIKLAFIFFFVFQFVSYLQMVLYLTLKGMHLNECRNKQVAFKEVTVFSQVIWMAPIMERESPIFLVAAILTLVFPVLFSKPKDFVIPEHTECHLCKEYSEKYNSAFPFSDRRLVGHEIGRHLKITYQLPGICFRKFGRYCCDVWQKSRLSRFCLSCDERSRLSRVICDKKSRLSCAIRVVLSLIGITCGILILVPLSAIFGVLVFLYFVCFSNYTPFLTLLGCCVRKLSQFGSEKMMNLFKFVLFLLLFFSCYVPLLVVSLNSFYFLTSALGYVILGLTLNISIVTPFAVSFLALTTNLYLCYENMQNKYKDIKKIISERREELHMIHYAPKDTISAKLYWFVCDKVLPHEYEILRMIRNMVFVSAYLFLALSSIVFFGNKYDISTLTLTISLFFTGSIPSLFLKSLSTNSNVIGWAKIKMIPEIDHAIKQY
ncbi:uncharacterized protein LOC122948997 [Acropora millepora]|uniref:uncharacterized protein LOC122948997 n=1 Tax=Acropora millepora TaxID=45264 RepID=UPI001CF2BF31|nr:uncharacterized protein LOC122948997 [Acropora millepora]